MIVFNERHLLRILLRFVDDNNGSRTHVSLDEDAPNGREVEPPSMGEIRAAPEVGGLHHRYTRGFG